MIIEDQGIIVGVRNFEERYKILQCFQQHNGLMSGLIRNSTLHNSNCLLANIVDIQWFARTHEQLGTYKLELIHNTIAAAALDRVFITVVSSVIAMLKIALHPKDPHKEFFNLTKSLFLLAADYQINHLLRQYLLFEMHLLKISGFGLDLTKCVATGCRTDLVYLSPKLGAAISKASGAPYHDRILPLPQAMLEDQRPISINEFFDCLRITEFFIEKNVLLPYGKRMPSERDMMISTIGALKLADLKE